MIESEVACIVHLQEICGTFDFEKSHWLKVHVIYEVGCTIDKPENYGKFHVDRFAD